MPDVETIRVILPENKIVKINVLPVSGLIPADVARLSLPNVFLDVNTFPGIRFGSRLVSSDYTAMATDFEIIVDASSNSVTITLPPAVGDGQLYHIKRIDGSTNAVTVMPVTGDSIDGSTNLPVPSQWDGLLLFDARLNQWDNLNTVSSGSLPGNVALRDAYNQFTQLNTFTGVQFGSRTVTSDYSLTQLDFEILVDASGGDVAISLPVSTGSGQTYHIKKIDDTGNIVTIEAQGSDLIDDSSSLSLGVQWSDALLVDGATGYWDNVGGSLTIDDLTDVARLSLPNVFLDVNTFPGIRLGTKLVSSDYALQGADCELLVDASAGMVTITLPPAVGDGQIYRVKKIDDSTNSVTVVPQAGDLIDDAATVTLQNQWDGIRVADAAITQWDNLSRSSPFSLPSNVALRDAVNYFSQLNSFTGLQLTTQTVSADYSLTILDFEVLVDASSGSVTISLPPSTGSGQFYRIKKIDDSANIVTVAAAGTDLIDGSVSLNFADQWADCQLIDAAPGYWDNTGSASGGGGGGADFGANGRVVDLFPIKGFAFEVYDGATWIEQVRYTEPGGGGPPAIGPAPTYWRPEIIDLTTLKAFQTALLMVNTRLDCPYGAASNVTGPLASYILETGPADGADQGQVDPDDYDVGTNDKHWRQML